MDQRSTYKTQNSKSIRRKYVGNTEHNRIGKNLGQEPKTGNKVGFYQAETPFHRTGSNEHSRETS